MTRSELKDRQQELDRKNYLFSMSMTKNVKAIVLMLSLLFFLKPVLAESKCASALGVQVSEEKIGDKLYQVSKALIKVKPEMVWQILADYDNAQYIFPCLKRCKLIKDKGNVKVVEHEIKPSGIPGTFEYVLEIKETVNRMQEWHRLSGDFREVDGFWKLEPAEDGKSTLVTYASYVNGGLFIPQGLIRYQIRTDIPSVMAALKAHAETVRQIAAGAGGTTRTP